MSTVTSDESGPPPISEEELREAVRTISASVAKFCSSVVGFKPFGYQRSLLEDRSKRIVVCAGRQVGKSLLIAARALWFALTHPRSTTIIVSATQSQSIMTFDKIIDYVDSSSEILQKSIVRKTRTLIRFSNGSKIVAKPCGRYGKSLRGETAHFIIADEAAFVPEEVIGEVLMPMLSTTDGTMIMLSTPYDKSHFFFRAFNSPRWSRHHFITADNPLVTKDFLDEQLEMWGERRFRQEYLAEFVDDEDTFLPMALLRSRVHLCDRNLGAPCDYCSIISGKSLPSKDLYAGYDPGGMADYAALVVVQKLKRSEESKTVFRVILEKSFVVDKRKKNIRRSSETAGADKDALTNIYTKFTAEVSDIHSKMHFSRLLMDATGLGRPIYEQCRELGLPVSDVAISKSVKEEIFSNLKLLLEKGQLELPDSLDLLSSLNSVIVRRTRTADYRFDHLPGTHDDLAFALALALKAAKSGSGQIAIIRV